MPVKFGRSDRANNSSPVRVCLASLPRLKQPYSTSSSAGLAECPEGLLNSTRRKGTCASPAPVVTLAYSSHDSPCIDGSLVVGGIPQIASSGGGTHRDPGRPEGGITKEPINTGSYGLRSRVAHSGSTGSTRVVTFSQYQVVSARTPHAGKTVSLTQVQYDFLFVSHTATRQPAGLASRATGSDGSADHAVVWYLEPRWALLFAHGGSAMIRS